MAPRSTCLRLAKGSIVAFLLGVFLGWIAEYPHKLAHDTTSAAVLPRMVEPSGGDRNLANTMPFRYNADSPQRSSGDMMPVPNWVSPASRAVRQPAIPAKVGRDGL
jgi:hypothetical protein